MVMMKAKTDDMRRMLITMMTGRKIRAAITAVVTTKMTKMLTEVVTMTHTVDDDVGNAAQIMKQVPMMTDMSAIV